MAANVVLDAWVCPNCTLKHAAGCSKCTACWVPHPRVAQANQLLVKSFLERDDAEHARQLVHDLEERAEDSVEFSLSFFGSQRKRKRDDVEAKCGDMSHVSQVLDVGSPGFLGLWKDHGKVAQSLAFEWCEFNKTLEPARGPATERQPQVLILNSSSWLEYSTLYEHGGAQPARAPPTPAHGRAARAHCCPRPRTLSPRPRTRTR